MGDKSANVNATFNSASLAILILDNIKMATPIVPSNCADSIRSVGVGPLKTLINPRAKTRSKKQIIIRKNNDIIAPLLAYQKPLNSLVIMYSHRVNALMVAFLFWLSV